MKKGNIQILDLDFEYKLWKNRLMFFESELELLLDRSIVLVHEHREWQMEDTIKKKLQDHLSAVQIIQSRIITQEQEMALYAEDYPIDSQHSHYSVHEGIREEIERVSQQHAVIFSDIYSILCYPISSKKE